METNSTPQQKTPDEERESGKGKKALSSKMLLVLVVVVAFVLGVLCSAIFYLKLKDDTTKHLEGGQREAAAIEGSLTRMNEEETQSALNKVVEDGMFRIHISSNIKADTNGNAVVNIENNLQNNYLMQVTIFIDDTDTFGKTIQTEIYRSGIIKPGFYIEKTVLQKPLPEGNYTGQAVFTALYPDTEQIVGQVGAQLTISVTNAPTPTPVPTDTPNPLESPSVTEGEVQ